MLLDNENEICNSWIPKIKQIKMMIVVGIKLVHVPYIIRHPTSQPRKSNRNKIIRTLPSAKHWKSIDFSGTSLEELVQTGENYPKLTGKSYILSNQKRRFEPGFHTNILGFYYRDHFSKTVPGNQDVKENKKKKIHISEASLEWLFERLHQKLITKNTDLKCLFAIFAPMRASYFVLDNFSNRKTCLCTYHQNFASILKKPLNISTRLETIFKFTDEKILSKVKGIKIIQFSFDFWEKVTGIQR